MMFSSDLTTHPVRYRQERCLIINHPSRVFVVRETKTSEFSALHRQALRRAKRASCGNTRLERGKIMNEGLVSTLGAGYVTARSPSIVLRHNQIGGRCCPPTHLGGRHNRGRSTRSRRAP
jgi:hypothetical protein